MNKFNIANEDVCDVFENKVCDNCGTCLKLDGVDVRAINIEDIAKNVEENDYLINELKNISNLKEDTLEVSEDSSVEEEYIDAFDNIEYIDDLESLNEESFDTVTEEVYPGVRRLKIK